MSYSFNLTNRDMTQVKRLSTAERLIMTERTRLPCWRQRARLWGRRGDGPSSLHLWPHQRVIGPRPATLSAVYSLKSTIRTRNTWALTRHNGPRLKIRPEHVSLLCLFGELHNFTHTFVIIYQYDHYHHQQQTYIYYTIDPLRYWKKWIMGYLCSETQRTYLLN